MSLTLPTIQSFDVERATKVSRTGGGVAGILLVGLVSMPWWAGRGELRFITEFLYFLSLAQMWNLLAGYGGLVSIGQQAFVGIGAYTILAAVKFLGMPPYLMLPVSGLVAVFLALPTAALLFRLRAAYFAIGAWVVAEVFRLLVANTPAVGGGSGASITEAVRDIPAWWRDALTFWTAVFVGVGAMALVYLLLRSRFGLALTAIRDSERASISLGVRASRIKLFVYLIAAFGAGVVGGLITLSKLRISPDAAFSVDWTAVTIFIVVIGGIGTVEGPLVGAIVYFALRSMLGDLGPIYMITLGIMAVGVMLVYPKGIWGYVAQRWDIHFFPVQRRLKSKDS